MIKTMMCGAIVVIALVVPTILYILLMNIYEKYIEKGGK